MLVHIPITHKINPEGYWRITYSGAPVVSGSRTLHVGTTSVKVEVPQTRNISWVLEKHRYHDNDGNHCEKVMSLYTGATLPATTDYRKFYDSSSDAYFKPGNGMTGIAQLDAMAFEDNGNVVQPLNIANEEVDQSME